MHVDQIRNAAHRLKQNIINHLKSINRRRLLTDCIEQALIGNCDQGINIFPQFFQTDLGHPHLLLAFKTERLGRHSNHQSPGLTSQLGNHRRSAGSRTPTHAGRNKDHISS